jgi:hypothetical protein
MKKHYFLGFIAIMFFSLLAFTGCTDIIEQSGSQIPSDLRNTSWSRQVSETETVTITFDDDTLIVSSDDDSSQYDQEWNYRGANCCGYGYCGFYNGNSSLDFQYTNSNGTLNISRCNIASFNGSWTRK